MKIHILLAIVTLALSALNIININATLIEVLIAVLVTAGYGWRHVEPYLGLQRTAAACC